LHPTSTQISNQEHVIWQSIATEAIVYGNINVAKYALEQIAFFDGQQRAIEDAVVILTYRGSVSGLENISKISETSPLPSNFLELTKTILTTGSKEQRNAIMPALRKFLRIDQPEISFVDALEIMRQFRKVDTAILPQELQNDFTLAASQGWNILGQLMLAEFAKIPLEIRSQIPNIDSKALGVVRSEFADSISKIEQALEKINLDNISNGGEDSNSQSSVRRGKLALRQTEQLIQEAQRLLKALDVNYYLEGDTIYIDPSGLVNSALNERARKLWQSEGRTLEFSPYEWIRNDSILLEPTTERCPLSAEELINL
jgi:hypothetical protein